MTEARAQIQTASVDENTTIIVHGNLEETLPKELSRYGNDLTTISSDEIKQSGAVDLASALDTVPGLYVMPGSGPFSYVDVSLQGSRTQDVLWTVDSMRINNRLYSSTSPNDTLPASMIERIEVLKGGESLFYGTQAAAGVINVVTRAFSDRLGGEVNVSLDSLGGTGVDGYVRGAFGKNKYVAYVSRNESEGYKPYSVMEPSATDRKRGYRVLTVGGKYQYDITQDLRVNAQYQHTDARLDNLSATRIRKSRNDRDEDIAGLRLDYQPNDAVELLLKGYYHRWDTAYVQIRNDLSTGDPVVIYAPGTYWGFKDQGLSALLKLNLTKNFEYLLGYDYQSYSGRDDVYRIGDLSESVNAGILQVRTTDDLSKRGHLAAGIRYNETGGAKKTVWNITGRYDLTGALYVEGNAGTNFLLPSAEQLYVQELDDTIGNPNLRPEQSLNLNLSLGGRLPTISHRIDWQVTAFAKDITDLIDYVDNADPATAADYPYTFANIDGKTQVRGVEFQMNAMVNQNWRVSGSYTLNRSRDEGANRQRERTPEQLATASIDYSPEAKPYGVNLAVNWVGNAWSTPSGFDTVNYGNYAVVNLGSHLDFGQGAIRKQIIVSVENLFDQDYATRGYSSAQKDDGSGRFIYYARGVPRTFRVKLGLGF